MRHLVKNITGPATNMKTNATLPRCKRIRYGNRTIASDLTNPNFTKLAESFGVVGLRATSPQALQDRLEEAFKMEAPVLIEAPIGEMPDPWSSVLKLSKVGG